LGTLTKGKTFGAAEEVTNTKLHNLIDLGSVAAIVNADIDNATQIAATKLAAIATASKVSGAALFNLASTPAGGGVLPTDNWETGASPTFTDLTLEGGLTMGDDIAMGGKDITNVGSVGDLIEPIMGILPWLGDGSDGTPDFSSGGAISGYTKEYVAMTIPEGQTVTCAKEVTIIAVQGTVTIAGTLTAAGKGGAKGAGGAGGSPGTAGGTGSKGGLGNHTTGEGDLLVGGSGGGGGGGGGDGGGSSNKGGKGGTGGGAGGNGGAGGAGGTANGGNGVNGSATPTIKTALLIYGDRMNLVFSYGAGGGGGGGGGTNGGAGGAGGNGGGSIIIFCKELVFTGTINTSGSDGSVGSTSVDHGGGGGGAGGGGGTQIILANTITTNTGTKTTTAGSGGAGGDSTNQGDGGDGGDGVTGISLIEETG